MHKTRVRFAKLTIVLRMLAVRIVMQAMHRIYTTRTYQLVYGAMPFRSASESMMKQRAAAAFEQKMQSRVS